MGGEKLSNSTRNRSIMGSPPHRRGKGGTDRSGDLRHGFTPAQAGKSWNRHRPSRHSANHPRACGEKPNSRRMSSCRVGSPPRGRGKAQFGNCPYCHERITPAWAGKRKSTESVKSCKKDHPRVGGEKRLDAGHRNHTQGSPPRGRGKGGNLPGRVRPQGITPAWAGKSLRAGSTARPKGGSPPRGRGKGLRWSGYAQNHGITPALAGKRRN